MHNSATTRTDTEKTAKTDQESLTKNNDTTPQKPPNQGGILR